MCAAVYVCSGSMSRLRLELGCVKRGALAAAERCGVCVLVSPYHGNGDWQILLENFVGRSRPLATYCYDRLCIRQLLDLFIYWTSIVIEQVAYDYYE